MPSPRSRKLQILQHCTFTENHLSMTLWLMYTRGSRGVNIMQFSMFTALLQWLNLLISSLFFLPSRPKHPFYFCPAYLHRVIYSHGCCNSKQDQSYNFSSLSHFNLADLNLSDTAITLSISDLTRTCHYYFFLFLP